MKTIVRILPFILHFYILVVSMLAWQGIDISRFDCLFACNVPLAAVLLALCYEQGKYHCKHVRASLWYLLAVSIINFLLDGNTSQFAVVTFIIMQIGWLLTTSITAYLAIRHFERIQHLKSS